MTTNRFKSSLFLLAFCTLASLISLWPIACGGNEIDVPKYRQTFNSALSRGDLAEVTIDTNKMVLDYKITEGDLVNQNGTLKLEADAQLPGKLFVGDKTIPVIAIHNEVIIGRVDNDFYLGVPNQTAQYDLSKIAGVYNFVAYLPNGFTDPGSGVATTLKTTAGTFKINADNTWESIEDRNLADPTTVAKLKGTLTDNGKGVLDLAITEVASTPIGTPTKLGNALIRIDADGRHFIVLDFAWTGNFKGFGFGQKQVSAPLVAGVADGNYLIISPNAQPSTGLAAGTSLKLSGLSFTLAFDSPWQGLIHGKQSTEEFYGIYSQVSKAVYGVSFVQGTTSPFVAIQK